MKRSPSYLLNTTAWVTLAGFAMTGCSGPTLPPPQTGPQVGGDPVVVPYPPPPAQVEVIMEEPDDMPRAVWIDGQWKWTGRRWEWTPGQWTVPIEGTYYALPKTVRLDNGDLVWFEGRWMR